MCQLLKPIKFVIIDWMQNLRFPVGCFMFRAHLRLSFVRSPHHLLFFFQRKRVVPWNLDQPWKESGSRTPSLLSQSSDVQSYNHYHSEPQFYGCRTWIWSRNMALKSPTWRVLLFNAHIPMTACLWMQCLSWIRSMSCVGASKYRDCIGTLYHHHPSVPLKSYDVFATKACHWVV